MANRHVRADERPQRLAVVLFAVDNDRGTFLECGPDAQMQLDGEFRDVKPGLCILIPPGVRHRAIGKMKVVIVASPKFDPGDEWLD